MPSFVFIEFDRPLDWSGEKNPAQVESLYQIRDVIEQALLAHGCKWIRPQGKRLLAVFDEEHTLQAVGDILTRLSGASPTPGLLPVKIAVHQGEATQGTSGWYGPEVDHTHAVLDASPSGTILVSEAASGLPLPEPLHRMSLGLHRLKDLRPPEELFTLYGRDLNPVDFPIPRSLGSFKQNLPAQATPFLGRREELLDLRKRFEDPKTRLVTLLGPGGFGKTRLALQAAASLLEDFDGVYWVALAPLIRADRLSDALAEALGLGLYGGEDPFERILTALQGRNALLVFDNFEHLPGGRQYVHRLLDSTQVRVLVTSREVMRIEGEEIFEVGGLKYPDRAEVGDFEEYSAVQLFEAAMRRSGHGKPLEVGQREPFLALCRQLHGMPLGLEMAASLAPTRPLEEIVKAVGGRLDLLATSLPHLPDRQKSVRAVFEYSWNLLEDPLRLALMRLSVVQGAFDLRAARRIAHCGSGELRRLMERSLLVERPEGGYLLHEIVRYYSKEHLFDQAPLRQKAQADHARFYLATLRLKLKGFEGMDQRAHLDEVAGMLDNLRGAFLWATETGRLRWVSRSLEAYGLFFDRKGRFLEGWEAIDAILRLLSERDALPTKGPAPALRGNLLSWRAFLGVRMGVAEGAEESLEEAIRILEGRRFRRRRAYALLTLGQVHDLKGRSAAAMASMSEALALFQDCGNTQGMAFVQNRMGQSLLGLGQIGTVVQLVGEALRHYEAAGNPSGTAWSRMLLGQAALRETRCAEAKKFFRLGLEGYLTVGNRDGVGWAMALLGQVARLQGDYAGAEQMFREGLLIEEEINNLPAVAWIKLQRGKNETARGRAGEAAGLFRESLDLYRRIGNGAGAAEALQALSELALEKEDPDGAEEYLRDAEKEAGTANDPLRDAWGNTRLARAALLRGDVEKAGRLLKEAQSVYERLADPRGLAWAQRHQCELALKEGRLEEAAVALRASLGKAVTGDLRSLVLEDWLGWAELLEKKGKVQTALEWLEAVHQHPAVAGPTAQRAAMRREEWGRRLGPEERAYARRAAAGADLGDWSDRILSSAPASKSAPKPRKR